MNRVLTRKIYRCGYLVTSVRVLHFNAHTWVRSLPPQILCDVRLNIRYYTHQDHYPVRTYLNLFFFCHVSLYFALESQIIQGDFLEKAPN
jgi:hypothetical protein